MGHQELFRVGIVFLFVLTLSFVNGKTKRQTSDPVCDSGRADVVFIIDESSSLQPSDFAKAQEFLKTFITMVPTGTEGYQIGLVRFSDAAETVFRFNTMTSKEAMIGAIDGMEPKGGATNTSGALREALSLFLPSAGNRGDVLDVVIFVTDGVDNVANERTAYDASVIRRMPGRTFAIGVGQAIDLKELGELATDPDDFHVYNLDSFDMLNDIVEDLILKTCFQRGCGLEEADIIILLDMSGSVTEAQFMQTKAFIKGIVDDLELGPTKSQIGLMTFAETVIIQFDLDRYTSKTEIFDKIDSIQYEGGTTRTVEALERLREMFTVARGDRNNNPDIVFVITDGRAKDIRASPYTIKEQAQLAKDRGIQFYCLGIRTTELSPSELRLIASDPKELHLFYVDDFTDLASLRGIIACLPPQEESVTIPAPATTVPVTSPVTPTAVPTVVPPACRRGRADVVFVIDRSGSIMDENFLKMLDFIRFIVLDLDIGNSTTRVGAMSFSDAPVVNFHLNRYQSRYEVAQAITGIEHKKGSTLTVAALTMLRTVMFQQENGDRDGVPNIAIFVTDGSSKDGNPQNAARLAHEAGISIFVIAVKSEDPFVNPTELNDIASDPDEDYLFNIDSFDALPNIKDKIAEGACLRVPICQDGVADITLLLDVSGSVESVKSNVLLAARALVEDLNIAQNGQRVAAIKFSDDPEIQFPLRQYNDIDSLINAIDKVTSVGGATNIAHALTKMESQVFTVTEGDRPTVTNVAVLITDGVSTVYETETLLAAETAKRNGTGTLIFALGLGPAVDVPTLEKIASPPSRLHTWVAYTLSELYDATEAMAEHSCFKKVSPGK